jgi:HNH endonuclease
MDPLSRVESPCPSILILNSSGTPWNVWNLFNFVSKLRQSGENLFPDMVPVSHGGRVVTYAYVDPEDITDMKRHEWTLTDQGYAQFWNKITKRSVMMHRYVMDFPEGLVVDHIYWNRLDNRKEMLRTCTQAENARNGSNGYRFGKIIIP